MLPLAVELAYRSEYIPAVVIFRLFDLSLDDGSLGFCFLDTAFSHAPVEDRDAECYSHDFLIQKISVCFPQYSIEIRKSELRPDGDRSSTVRFGLGYVGFRRKHFNLVFQPERGILQSLGHHQVIIHPYVRQHVFSHCLDFEFLIEPEQGIERHLRFPYGNLVFIYGNTVVHHPQFQLQILLTRHAAKLQPLRRNGIHLPCILIVSHCRLMVTSGKHQIEITVYCIYRHLLHGFDIHPLRPFVLPGGYLLFPFEPVVCKQRLLIVKSDRLCIPGLSRIHSELVYPRKVRVNGKPASGKSYVLADGQSDTVLHVVIAGIDQLSGLEILKLTQ